MDIINAVVVALGAPMAWFIRRAVVKRAHGASRRMAVAAVSATYVACCGSAISLAVLRVSDGLAAVPYLVALWTVGFLLVVSWAAAIYPPNLNDPFAVQLRVLVDRGILIALPAAAVAVAATALFNAYASRAA